MLEARLRRKYFNTIKKYVEPKVSIIENKKKKFKKLNKI